MTGNGACSRSSPLNGLEGRCWRTVSGYHWGRRSRLPRPAKLTVLEAPHKGIVNLTGLEYATGLRRLGAGLRGR